MDRERAETYLRQLAETELRRATTPGGRNAHRAGSLHLAAYTLMTVGAIDIDTLNEVHAELELAEAMRWPAEGRAAALRRNRLTWVRPRRDVTGPSAVSRQPPWRVVPVGQVIGIRGEVRGELGLLAYVQTAHGGRFTMAGWMHGPAPDPQWRFLAVLSPGSSPPSMIRAPYTPSASAPGWPAPRCYRACST